MLVLGFITENEDPILDSLNKIKSIHGKEAVYNLSKLNLTLDVSSHFTFAINSSGPTDSYELNLFTSAIVKNFLRVVSLLIDCGVEINFPLAINQAHIISRYTEASPLTLACSFASSDIVQLLLKNHANILHVTKNGMSVLMAAKSVEVCRLILEAAKEQKCLNELLKTQDNNSNTIFNTTCQEGKIEILHELLKLENYIQYCNVRSFLHDARMATWLYPAHAQEFESICKKLKPFQEEKIPIVEFSSPSANLGISDAYFYLFQERINLSITVKSKDQATKYAISQIYILFSSFENISPYLRFLSNEFSRYYFEKNKSEFPALNSSSYHFKMINGLNYPFPNNENYEGIKKNKSLHEFIILLLNKYNLAKNFFKLIGLIPNNILQEIFANGDFILEDSLGLTLFHGVLSHVIQYIIILYAMEHGKISRDYVVNGVQQQISIEDILHKFADDLKLRQLVLDIRYPESISASDPFRLISIIMEKGHEFGFKQLADSIIDSFCKGIIKRMDACKKIFNLPLMDMETFSEQTKDLRIEAFTDTPLTMNYAKQIELNKHDKKSFNKATFFAESYSYAVVRKEYEPNKQFIPKKFEY